MLENNIYHTNPKFREVQVSPQYVLYESWPERKHRCA